MGNHIFHSIKHIKYVVIQQYVIFNFKKNITIGYTIIIMSIMCLVLEWFEKFNIYIFRIIAHLFDIEGYLLWFDTSI